MDGHLFVAQGDLTRLECDAWLLPSDAGFSVEEAWLGDPAVRAAVGEVRGAPPDGWPAGRVAATRLPAPRPYLADVGTTPREPSWYVAAARSFLAAAWADFSAGGGEPRHGRARPLFGLPVVGTGGGGAGPVRGQVLSALVDELRSAVAGAAYDVVLVVPDRRLFAAAQAVRRRVDDPGCLEPRLLDEARSLAALARTGHLVLFLGAGVGTAAGLPDWAGLIGALAAEAKVPDAVRPSFDVLDSLDQARLLQGRLAAAGRDIGEVVAELFRRQERYALPHALLASLPVREAATLNWDALFEAASADAGREVAVLPYQSAVGASRWLLKLHGSVDDPGGIVLTREDYLRYPERYAALAGVAQALLVTRHMLFVGFGLADDHFHAMVHDVRAALRQARSGDESGAGHRPFGTVLSLTEDPLLTELWEPDLRFVPLSRGADRAEAKRLAEVFLDRLLLEATTSAAYLLDPTFAEMLTDDEAELARLLEPLRDAASAERLRECLAAEPMRTVLVEYGG